MDKDPIQQVIDAAVAALSDHPGLAGIKVRPGLSPSARPAPLRSPVITVSLKNMEHTPGGMGGYLGGTVDELRGSRVKLSLAMTLYMPYETGGAGLFAIYSRAAAALLEARLPLSVLSCAAGEAAFDRAAGAYTLAMSASLTGYCGTAEDSASFTEITLLGGIIT